jgi:hypothetical protein
VNNAFGYDISTSQHQVGRTLCSAAIRLYQFSINHYYMKQFLLFACLSIFSLSLSAQVYVDIDATGSGDGTTWADAYTSLNDALLAADAGSEVWIADGTYVTPDTTSFFVDKELTILGGFNGTEAAATDAAPNTNVVILSGDVMGNDVAGYDSLSRVDNNRVIFFQDTNAVSAYTITLDGVTIQNGNIEGFVDGSLLPFAGGGLLSFAKSVVSRVNFTANHADFGSAIAMLFNTSDDSTFDDINVTGNTTENEAQVYNRLNTGVVFSKSTFNGAADTGANASVMVFANEVGAFTVTDCVFDSISTASGRGAGVNITTGVDGKVLNSTFTNCSADLGGAVYLRNFDPIVDAGGGVSAGDMAVENCDFSDIASSRWGGVVLLSQVNSVVKNVTISDVESLVNGGLGGALYLQSNAEDGTLPLSADWQDISISDVEAGGAGGGIFIFTESVYTVNMKNVTLDNVVGGGSGGGLYLNGNGVAAAEENVAVLDNISISNAAAEGFGGGSIFFAQDVDIKNSTFKDNQTALDSGNGGGVYAQGTGITVRISDSEFEGNRALSGSGLAVFGAGQQTTVKRSTFDGNGTVSASAFRGGAMAFFQGDGSNVSIDSTDMINNSTTADEFVSGGGAMYVSNITDVAGDFSVTNSRIEANTVADSGNGGGIYFIDGVTGTIENTNFLFNSANDGGALAALLFEIPDTVNNIPMVSLPAFDVDVNNSLIISNTAGNQGGAVTTQRAMMNFTNVVFARNEVGGDGASGGAISFNGTPANVDANNDFESASLSVLTTAIVNCSFFANVNGQGDGDVGNAISLFQPQNPFNDTEQSITLTLQNNVFFQEEEGQNSIDFEPATDDPATAFGTISVVSNGGNFFNAPNSDQVVLGALDITDLTAIDSELLFEDPFENTSEFPLLRPLFSDDNPLIGTAVTGGLLPATGIDGNPRGDEPEIGAYELEWGVTSVQPVEESGLDMSFFPNPTVDVVNIQNNDASIQNFTVVVTDMSGRIITSAKYNGTVNRLDLTNVPTGVYNLQLEVNGSVYSKQIVKQ